MSGGAIVLSPWRAACAVLSIVAGPRRRRRWGSAPRAALCSAAWRSRRAGGGVPRADRVLCRFDHLPLVVARRQNPRDVSLANSAARTSRYRSKRATASAWPAGTCLRTARVLAYPGRSGPSRTHDARRPRVRRPPPTWRGGRGESEGDPNAFGWGATKDVAAGVAFLRDRPDVEAGGSAASASRSAASSSSRLPPKGWSSGPSSPRARAAARSART